MSIDTLPLSLTLAAAIFGSNIIFPQRSPGQSARPESVRVAAVQISGYDKRDQPRANFDPAEMLVPYIDRAGKEGAQLVVFPEYVLGHIQVPGVETEQLSVAAARNGIYVIVGCWERLDAEAFANTALLFDRKGQIAGKYRKTHAAVDQFEGNPPWSHPPQEKSRDWFRQNDPEWIMEKGTDLPVFDLDFGRIGIMTCYDGWFPEPPRILSLRGAELIVWINGRGGSVEEFIVKSIMFQSHVAVIATNQAYGAGTMIGDQPVQILARCPDKTEAYISETINFSRIRHRRGHSRNFQQRRPDLYGDLSKTRVTEQPDSSEVDAPEP